MDFRQFTNATSFGLKDPLFHLDISFYVFKLAFLTKANNIVLGIVVGVVIITLLYYGILITVRTPDMFEWEPEEPEGPETSGENAIPFSRKYRKKPSEKRTLDLNNDNMIQLLHIASGKLTLLGIVFYLMVAMDFLMRQFDLLHVHTGAVYGAGFTDVNVKLWVYRLIMVLSIVGAVTLWSPHAPEGTEETGADSDCNCCGGSAGRRGEFCSAEPAGEPGRN